MGASSCCSCRLPAVALGNLEPPVTPDVGDLESSLFAFMGTQIRMYSHTQINKNKIEAGVEWNTLIIPALGRHRQEG